MNHLRELELASICATRAKQPGSTQRLWFGRVMVAIIFIGLLSRLAQLQIVEGAKYRDRSDSNRLAIKTVSAPRGVVIARDGSLLIRNLPVATLITDEAGRIQGEADKIAPELSLELGATESGGLIFDVTRNYPYGELFAHVTGYVGPVSESEIEAGALPTAVSGRAGIERWYQSQLQGRDGKEYIEINATGKLLRRHQQVQAVSGLDLTTSLEPKLQQALLDAFEGRKGAAVASHPYTGEVFALVSSPSYDPNLFLFEQQWVGDRPKKREAKAALQALLTDDTNPLLNRSIAGTYPPGSVYKIIPSIAGLETETIKADTEIEDSGVITINQFQYRNWYFTKYGRTDGLVDVVTALKRSNDVYYYRLGEWLGPERLAEWSRTFRLGRLSNIDLPGEVPGLVPDPAWKLAAKKERWFLGNTYHMAIGQGDVLVNPVQLNQAFAVVASDGSWCKPRIVTGIGDQVTAAECVTLDIAPSSLEPVKRGLEAVCESGGTAFPFFDFSLESLGAEYQGERAKVACKTGTAQYVNPDNFTHAWFSVYAPAKDPEIVITVLVEGAGEGSEQAAPIAKKALEVWFGLPSE